MSYSTYTTEAIVCGTRDRNTTDRSFLLFTQSGGMLYAEARAVRRENSKQRHALQDFTRVRISLIRGKSGWRVGSVEALENYYANAVDREARGSVVGLVKMLRRFARGEEAMTEVYEFIKVALAVLTQSQASRTFLDAYVQVHFLAYLGYVALGMLPAPLQHTNVTSAGALASKDYEALLRIQLESAVVHSHL
ncbi:recombination protein O N-terminal domain-containing protein [Patescibacteria group bacterium]|nr:recombination protein O N-terminal domain-containing protein [Patescibacteria group bacterium]